MTADLWNKKQLIYQLSQNPENTHHGCHCMADHLIDWDGFYQLTKSVVHSKHISPNKINRSAVQRYYPNGECSLFNQLS